MNETDVNSCVHGNFFSVTTNDLTPDSKQARKFHCPVAHDELTKSIIEHGLINPISVTLADGNLIIVAGERRWRAAMSAGLEVVPVIYVDRNVLGISLVENLQRENLLPMEKAKGLQLLRDQHAYSLEQLAKIIGKSVPTVSEILKLNCLTDDIKAECSLSDKFVHYRLLQIAKAPNRTMRKLFEAYKVELNGLKPIVRQRRNPGKLDGFLCRANGMITQIIRFDIEQIDDMGRESFFSKLAEFTQTIRQKFDENEANIASSSKFRNYEVSCCDGLETDIDSSVSEPDQQAYADYDDEFPVDSDINDQPIGGTPTAQENLEVEES